MEVVARFPITQGKYSRIDFVVYRDKGKYFYRLEVVIDLDTKEECKRFVRDKDGNFVFKYDFTPNKIILDALRREMGDLFNDRF